MELYSRTTGEGQDLIIMHGLFGMNDNWQTLGRRFSEKYRVHLLDLRNHGRSPHSEEMTYEAMSEDLHEYMEATGIEKATVLGHSLGGKAAMFFACEYPGMTESLIVADMGPQAYAVHHREIIDALKKMDVEKMDSRREADEKLARDIKEGSVRQFLLKNLYRPKGKDHLAWRFNLDVIDRKIENVGVELPEDGTYEGPTLFIRGNRSGYIGDKDLPRIESHFPEYKLVSLDAGHWLHAEQPDAFYDAVTDFLSRVA